MPGYISTSSGGATGQQGLDARVIAERRRFGRSVSTYSCRTRLSRKAVEAVLPQPGLAAPAWGWQAETKEVTL
jgi:hypothetical protein